MLSFLSATKFSFYYCEEYVSVSMCCYNEQASENEKDVNVACDMLCVCAYETLISESFFPSFFLACMMVGGLNDNYQCRDGIKTTISYFAQITRK